ncbi:hypothetical protein ACQ4PT_022020 [Festuca glaucescens]
MAPFITPADSLSRRYAQAYRWHTWRKVRTANGVKVLPPIRSQIGPTCIYEALMAWMESHLRLIGVIVRLSSKDLQEKEQAFMSEEVDRTQRCLDVISTLGVRSEHDYNNQIWDGPVYVVDSYEQFYSLHKEAIQRAVQSMSRGPILLAFNCDKTYFQYLGKYQSKPIFSYEKYMHEKMLTHAANSVGYGVENIVPCWEFMNSYGRSGPKKGFGRVVAQNAVRLIGLIKIDVVYPWDARNPKKRKREELAIDEDEIEHVLKKLRLR